VILYTVKLQVQILQILFKKGPLSIKLIEKKIKFKINLIFNNKFWTVITKNQLKIKQKMIS